MAAQGQASPSVDTVHNVPLKSDSKTRRLIGFITILWVVVLVSPQNAIGQASHKIRIYVNDQTINDSDEAKLTNLIVTTQPRANWWKVTTEKTQSIASLINEYFHRFGKQDSQGASPKTAQALTDAVRSANNLTSENIPAGTAIYLPPVPVRARSFCEEVECAIRTFDVNSKTYELKPSLDADSIAVSSGMTVNEIAASSQWRRARITELTVELDANALEKIRESKGALIPPTSIVTTDDGFDVVHFLDGPGDCEKASQWLDSSPYKPLLVDKLSKIDKKAISATASSSHLVIIDWDTAASGHGGKVRSVVDSLLRQLGLLEILSPSIESFDLNPSHSSRELEIALQEYMKYYASVNHWDDLQVSGVFALARNWLKGYKEPANVSQVQRIPSLVMQAVFYKYMPRTTWVNLSFYVESSAFEVLERRYMVVSKSVAVFAAGDTGIELSPIMMPQAWASHWPKLMNVTYGSRDGKILGDISSTEYDNYVTAVAPGCGYQGFSDNEKGSSFASPYVAASLWVQFLITGNPTNDLKSLAIVGSRLNPPQADGVESGGIFDPAFLLAAPPPHFIDQNGHYQPLAKMKLDFGVETDGGTINFRVFVPAPRKAKQTAIAPYECGGGVCVWSRTWNESRKRYDVAHYKLGSVKFSAVTVDGKTWVSDTTGEFRNSIQQLYY